MKILVLLSMTLFALGVNVADAEATEVAPVQISTVTGSAGIGSSN